MEQQINLSNQSINDYITYYTKLGFSVLPTKYKTKRINLPTWNLSDPVSAADIQQWKKEKRFEGIALLVGEPSNNLTVIDIDKPDYIPLQFLKEQLTLDENTIGFLVKTHRGYQLWFKDKEGEYWDNKSIHDYGIEYYSKKHIVIAPPSIHPKGSTYQFLIKPTWFKPTNVHNLWNNIYLYCMEHDPDEVLKPIMNPLIKQKIMNHLQNPDCEHNNRLWIVGFLHNVLHLDKKQILEFIHSFTKWDDYKPEKTSTLVTNQLRYIDRKVGEKGGSDGV